MRAILADRLSRQKLAERQYRKCVEFGSSYFAWWRLVTIYLKSNQPKAVLVCVAELLDRAIEDGIDFNGGRISSWIEEIVFKLVA